MKFPTTTWTTLAALFASCMTSASAVVAAGVGPNLVVNPSFELADDLSDLVGCDDAPVTGTPAEEDCIFFVVPGGSRGILGWQSVTPFDLPGRSVDWALDTIIPAADGRHSIDLNGTPGPGGIRQLIPTVIGQEYVVEFHLAGNPWGNLTPDEVDPVKAVIVKAAGQTSNFWFDVSNIEVDSEAVPVIPWKLVQWTFVADSEQTNLKFLSGGSAVAGQPEDFGAMIDNVSVRAVPEPATAMLALVGLGGIAYLSQARQRHSLIK